MSEVHPARRDTEPKVRELYQAVLGSNWGSTSFYRTAANKFEKLNDKNYWQHREYLRLYGAQAGMNEHQELYQPIHNTIRYAQENYLSAAFPILDFIHLATTDSDLIAYTPNEEDGQRDRQIRTTIGKYLTKRFPHLPAHDVARLAAYHRSLYAAPEYKWATTSEEVTHVYMNGPGSCLGGKDKKSSFERYPLHPAAMYLLTDVQARLAYMVRDGRITARAWVRDDKKLYIRYYGDELLHRWLIQQGYKQGTWVDATFPYRPVNLKISSYYAPEWPMLPWLDGGYQHIAVHPEDAKKLEELTFTVVEKPDKFKHIIYGNSASGFPEAVHAKMHPLLRKLDKRFPGDSVRCDWGDHMVPEYINGGELNLRAAHGVHGSVCLACVQNNFVVAVISGPEGPQEKALVPKDATLLFLDPITDHLVRLHEDSFDEWFEDGYVVARTYNAKTVVVPREMTVQSTKGHDLLLKHEVLELHDGNVAEFTSTKERSVYSAIRNNRLLVGRVGDRYFFAHNTEEGYHGLSEKIGGENVFYLTNYFAHAAPAKERQEVAKASEKEGASVLYPFGPRHALGPSLVGHALFEALSYADIAGDADPVIRDRQVPSQRYGDHPAGSRAAASRAAAEGAVKVGEAAPAEKATRVRTTSDVAKRAAARKPAASRR